MTDVLRPTYRQKRISHWTDNSHTWDGLANRELFANWDRPNLIPHSRVEAQELCLALPCFYAGDNVHGHAFCQRTIKVADRIIAEDRCRANDVCEAAYPRNLGVVLRGRTYARWFLGGTLDRAQMRRVAGLISEWCLTKALDHRRFHDSTTMNFYLQSIRAAMIACDLDYAIELLNTKHKLRWHHGFEQGLWKHLINGYPEVNEGTRRSVERFFDRVRDPDFEEKIDGVTPTFINRDILALETGIIRQMYVVNDSALDEMDPMVVIEAVAQ